MIVMKSEAIGDDGNTDFCRRGLGLELEVLSAERGGKETIAATGFARQTRRTTTARHPGPSISRSLASIMAILLSVLRLASPIECKVRCRANQRVTFLTLSPAFITPRGNASS